MDIRFLPHNTHLEHPDKFSLLDYNLRKLNQQTLVFRSSLLDTFPKHSPGIYTISGGRQVGKTTLMKQWMAELLRAQVNPNQIAYLTGELIEDHNSLILLLTEIIKNMPEDGHGYIIIDEVTYISGWDKGVKYMADTGMLENISLYLTGSDLLIIKEARMRFPGRRGASSPVDFHLYPLNFYEAVSLKGVFAKHDLKDLIQDESVPGIDEINILFAELKQYLRHGGFLTAMNDLVEHERILPATFATYSDWIRGDVLKRGKQENYLRELLGSIVKRYGSQLTWNVLCQDLSIDHPKTVADYVELLESMDALFVQKALIEDKLVPAPKKARKIIFTDPFILHSLRSWLKPVSDPYTQQVKPLWQSPEWISCLVEALVVNHYRQYYPTYYIKAQGEVDVAYIDQDRFWPIEVKWTEQLRPKDLKQISKYPNSRILTKSKSTGSILNIPATPLPLALLRLGAKSRPDTG